MKAKATLIDTLLTVIGSDCLMVAKAESESKSESKSNIYRDLINGDWMRLSNGGKSKK